MSGSSTATAVVYYEPIAVDERGAASMKRTAKPRLSLSRGVTFSHTLCIVFRGKTLFRCGAWEGKGTARDRGASACVSITSLTGPEIPRPLASGRNQYSFLYTVTGAPQGRASEFGRKRRRDEPQGVGAPVEADDYQVPSQKRVGGGKAKAILKATRNRRSSNNKRKRSTSFRESSRQGTRRLLAGLRVAATQADWARGSIREIKCQLCPNTTLKTWEDFKWHCNTKEGHPLKISFCEKCGDFFARSDSLESHRGKPPTECCSVTREEAFEKRRETQRTHDEFLARLEGLLRTGEGDIVMPFSQTIKEKYPDSSKKRRERRLDGR
ncbi:hypothetical protein DFH94DRAFT_846372 [Russula ochroleuca]|uniref:Uncharacterized protein n=1 Tax=Russula ochroleuca TaxID=152965 RepID=A0A9P5MRN3_9AGAM|nr:hypothetical protein DFH94DRAFT_846372 [Russula ochroleuca]